MACKEFRRANCALATPSAGQVAHYDYQRGYMPKFDVRVFAVEADDDTSLELGQVTVEAENEQEATDKAYNERWDARLSVTCNARFRVNAHEARRLAEQHLDAAPENAMSVEEYDWEFRMLSRQELLETGLLVHFAEHARNIQLDPSRSDLSRPVVVSIGDGERFRIAVWDGVHRIMSALALGHERLPAVVGTRKPEFQARLEPPEP